MFKNNLAVLAVIPLAGLLLSSPDILLAQELSKPGRARVSDLIQQTSADCAPANDCAPSADPSCDGCDTKGCAADSCDSGSCASGGCCDSACGSCNGACGSCGCGSCNGGCGCGCSANPVCKWCDQNQPLLAWLLCRDYCWYGSAHGWSPPVKNPVRRQPIQYQRYWPAHWNGTAKATAKQAAHSYSTIAMPTDTAQMGFYYHQVPVWRADPSRFPQNVRPSQWHDRCKQNGGCHHRVHVEVIDNGTSPATPEPPPAPTNLNNSAQNPQPLQIIR